MQNKPCLQAKEAFFTGKRSLVCDMGDAGFCPVCVAVGCYSLSFRKLAMVATASLKAVGCPGTVMKRWVAVGYT